MRFEALAGRRIGIVGFGREGRSALQLIHRHWPDLRVLVFNESPIEDPSLGDPLVELIVGPLSAESLSRCEILIKSPGVSLYRKELEAARTSGVIITSGTQLWFARARSFPVVSVTGSKGKSTTASLIRFLLQHAGVEAECAGNLGVPLLDLWDQSPQVLVVELSSYQTADFNGRPDVAVLTNLFPEHLDWHGSLDRYIGDKLRIFAQSPEICLLNGSDRESLSHCVDLPNRRLFAHRQGWQVDHDEVRYQGKHVAPLPPWALPGAHNRQNLAAALAAVDALGFDPVAGLTRLAEFRGLPHRLETVATGAGIRVVDDSISTAPHATVAALESLSGAPLALIVGGFDRGLDYSVVAERLARHPITAVIAQGASGRRIACTLREGAPGQRVIEAADLDDAVKRGLETLNRDGILLLSPGAPSYDEFSDFSERGKHFRALALAGIAAREPVSDQDSGGAPQ